jgi:hypothetical protein
VECARCGRSVREAHAVVDGEVAEARGERVAVRDLDLAGEVDLAVAVVVEGAPRSDLELDLEPRGARGIDPPDREHATLAPEDHLGRAVAVHVARRSKGAGLVRSAGSRYQRRHELHGLIEPRIPLRRRADRHDHAARGGHPDRMLRAADRVPPAISTHHHRARAGGELALDLGHEREPEVGGLDVDLREPGLQIRGHDERGEAGRSCATPRGDPMIRPAPRGEDERKRQSF